MTYQVKVGPKARRHLSEVNAWWIENRPAMATRVTDEAQRLLMLLADLPNTGALYEKRKGHEVRRLRLQSTPYYLYYIVNDEHREVLVVAIWSAMRGDGPPL